MADLLVLFPLAQMNTSTGGATGAAPGAGAAAPGIPPVENTGVTAAGAGGGAGAAGSAATPSTGGATTGSVVSTSQAATPEKPPASSPLTMIVPIILMFGVLYLVLFRGQNKEKKRREALMSELKKGDRVMTIGGMLARVVSIDGDEVVLKVDESANVKAIYRKSAIQEVIDRDDKK